MIAMCFSGTLDYNSRAGAGEQHLLEHVCNAALAAQETLAVMEFEYVNVYPVKSASPLEILAHALGSRESMTSSSDSTICKDNSSLDRGCAIVLFPETYSP